MHKWVISAILVLLLTSFVSAQEITGYIGLNVITPAQSVDATASLNVRNETPRNTVIDTINSNLSTNATNIIEQPNVTLVSASNEFSGTVEPSFFDIIKRLFSRIFG